MSFDFVQTLLDALVGRTPFRPFTVELVGGHRFEVDYARALVQRVDHPNFRTMYDTFHAHIEEKNVTKAIAGLGDSFIHVHISENDRGTPGTGLVHWDETFRALRKTNYDRWLVIEAFGRALPDLAAATRVWRDLFPNAEEVYTRGLQFIKEKWSAAR